MFIYKVIILIVVAVAIICMLVSPIIETLKVTSDTNTRSDKSLILSGTPYVLHVPVRLYLKLSFTFERPISKTFQLMRTKSTDGHKIKFQIRNSNLSMKPSWIRGGLNPRGMIPLGLIWTDKLNTLSVRISEPNLVVVFNNNDPVKVGLAFSKFAAPKVIFGKSKHNYNEHVCTITSFFIREQLQDLTKARKIEKVVK